VTGPAGYLEAQHGPFGQRTEKAIDRPRPEAEAAEAKLKPTHRRGAVLGAIARSAAEQTGGNEGGPQGLALLGLLAARTGAVAGEARGGGTKQRDRRQRHDQERPER
jgi:hypothetical protein